MRPFTVARQREREPQKAAVETVLDMSLSFGLWRRKAPRRFMNDGRRNPSASHCVS
ncbi:hypothetical protein EKH55_0178 [Sinorhizobium alkalisoli]|nr:hypothetical protein EKH55_0178 [Sinorhizobium alkalisoli]